MNEEEKISKEVNVEVDVNKVQVKTDDPITEEELVNRIVQKAKEKAKELYEQEKQKKLAEKKTQTTEAKKKVPLHVRLLNLCCTAMEISICHSIYLLSGNSWVMGLLALFGLFFLETKYICFRMPDFLDILLKNSNEAKEIEQGLKQEIALILIGLMVACRYMATHF